MDQRSKLIIGLIGSLNGSTKGIDVAMKAMARVKDKLPPFEFRILGDGSQDRWMKLARELSIADSVSFSGVLPSGSAVWEWLDGIDLYIQPSFQEGLPRATIEAMSRGCPVIGSTAGGIPELLEKACLHKPGNDRQLAEQLAAYAGNQNWMTRQAELNFARSSDYTKKKLDDKRERFWRSFRVYSEGIAPESIIELESERRGMA